MHAIFLTEGGEDIGFGHISRCMALAEAILQRGGRVSIVIRGTGLEISNMHPISLDISFFDWEYNKLKNEKFLEDATLCVIDSYTCSYEFCKYISTIVKQVLFFDDYFRLPYPNGSYVLNPGAEPDENPYHLFGLNYVVLRSAFWNIPQKKINEEIKKILISFGREDHCNIIPIVLSIIKNNLTGIELFVVTGKKEQQYNHVHNVKSFCNLSAEHMRDLMLESDLAISAGGQTLFELACTGTPTIGIITADNQLGNIRALKRATSFKSFFYNNILDVAIMLKRQIKRLLTYKIRFELSKQLQQAVTGQGAYKVVDKIWRDL